MAVQAQGKKAESFYEVAERYYATGGEQKGRPIANTIANIFTYCAAAAGGALQMDMINAVAKQSLYDTVDKFAPKKK